MSGLNNELLFLVLQFLDEEKFKETLHRLESESGVFCNVNYIEELVTKGEWDALENYLAAFISIDGNRYAVKMLFQIRKQRYIEAIEEKDGAKALEILNKHLKPFKTLNHGLYSEMTHLLTLSNIRENEQLQNYTDNKTARAILVNELKNLVASNPDLRDKHQFPSISASRLRILVNQSLNWQHHLCRTPRPNPEITSIIQDHVCEPPVHAAQASSSVVNNRYTASMFRAGFLPQPPLPPPEAALFLATPRGQGSVNPPPFTQHPNFSGARVRGPQITGDNEVVIRRPRHFGMPEAIRNLPTSSIPRPSHSQQTNNFLHTEDLPKNVVSVINQGSEVKTMDFHPEYQTLLAVGTNTGDVSIWEVGSRMQIAHKNFGVWNISGYSMAIQSCFSDGGPVLVNRIMWSPDGYLLGVAFSKHIVQIYSYRAGHDIQRHLEIEAHDGYVSDLVFTIRNQTLLIITSGQDTTIKVWNAITGANLFVFEGHSVPVSSICPHAKDSIQALDSYIFSTAIDGKIKAWLHGDPVAKIDFETPGFIWTKMAYNSDGTRFFSSGTSVDKDSFLVEWAENQGTVKRTYIGLGKQYTGAVQFDIASRFLAVGEESIVKFWDMDNSNLLFYSNAEGGLPVSPCIRFSKGATLLAVSTSDNGVKILANPEGHRLVKSAENRPEALRLGSASAAKASTGGVNSTSSAGTNIGLPDRSVSFAVMALPAVKQNNQNMSNVRDRKTDEVELPVIYRPEEIIEPSQLRSLKLPDKLLPIKVIRLMYTHLGSAILVLTDNAVHKLWRWRKSEQNPTAKASADVAPQMWQPASGLTMTNDIKDADVDNIVPCFALSKNHSYVVSASGGKVSLFNVTTFEDITSFMAPPPAATCLAFLPNDNNVIAAGMSDSSIHIYNVRMDTVIERLTGHQKPVTGLAFAMDKNILVSAGVDGELCVWNTDTWEKVTSQFLTLPSRRTNNRQAETRVHFNLDLTHFMVVHETQIAIYDPVKMDSCMQWVPRLASGPIVDAVYSCDGESIYVCVEDGSVSILAANPLKLKCRINFTAYNPPKRNAIRVRPNAIAAHPSNPNQLAIGLSDGGVFVLEPLEAVKQWGSDPSAETSPDLSTNPDPEQMAA